MDVYNELQKPTVTSSQRKFHKYFTETSSLPRHFTHISIGVPVSVCFESRYLPTPKTNMTMEHPPFESMYFLLNMGDFPVSHVSFQGVVRGIFLHCRRELSRRPEPEHGPWLESPLVTSWGHPEIFWEPVKVARTARMEIHS